MLFILIFTTVFGLAHVYVFVNVVKAFNLPTAAKWSLSLLFFFLGGTFILFRVFHVPWFLPVLISYTWFGWIFTAFSFLVVKDLLRIVLPFSNPALCRVFLFLALTACLVSLFHARCLPRVKHLAIGVPGLPHGSDSLKIVHLSDLHLQTITRSGYLDYLTRTVNRLDADLVVITGDLLDEKTTRFDEFVAHFKKMHAVHGIYAVPGNHDYYAGIDQFETFADRTGITVLRNETVTIADTINLAGIDDPASMVAGGTRPDVADVLIGKTPDLPTILLDHRPDGFREAARCGVDLQLSGHYHAGQIPPLDVMVLALFRYGYGLKHEGSSAIYTTSGTGTWGPPMRLLIGTEIPCITLQTEKTK